MHSTYTSSARTLFAHSFQICVFFCSLYLFLHVVVVSVIFIRYPRLPSILASVFLFLFFFYYYYQQYGERIVCKISAIESYRLPFIPHELWINCWLLLEHRSRADKIIDYYYYFFIHEHRAHQAIVVYIFFYLLLVDLLC